MPQTTGHITSKNVELELSTDGENWTHIDCSSGAVTPSGGVTMTGSTHVFCEHLPLIGAGNIEPTTLGIRLVYTEVENESCDLIDGFRVNQALVWLRYRPKGAESGAWEFTGQGYFITPITPAADATSADILTVDVDWFGVELALGVQGT